MNNNVTSKFFAMNLRLEDSGIFRRGWQPDELDRVEAICHKQDDVESGALAVVELDFNGEVMLKRIYKSHNAIVLVAPKNFDRPSEIIPSIVMTAREATKKLNILGKVIKFSLTLKDNYEVV